jgi:hypothetical protein
LLKYIISWSATDHLVHFRFDSNIIRCFHKSYFDYDGQMVPGLARSMERSANLKINCRYFHKNRRPEYPLKTTDLPRVTDKLYLVPIAMIGIKTHNLSGDVHWLHDIKITNIPLVSIEILNMHSMCTIFK